MTEVVSIAIEKWSAEDYEKATAWLREMYGPACSGIPKNFGGWIEPTWYRDFQPMCEDLVMRKDIYFMFVAAFGEDYGQAR